MLSGRTSTAAKATVCVGDIHGHLQRLLNLWHNLELHVGAEAFNSCTLIFLGDYNDRGPDTAGVLDFLISLPRRYPEQKHVFLCGNHDFAFAAFLGVLPPGPAGFSLAHTWKEFEKSRDREGWWSGEGEQEIHVQGVRWAGQMTVPFNTTKGTYYQGSTYDSKPTFQSYGVAHGDRQGLLKAVPDSHKRFLQDLVWVHEQEGVDTGHPTTSYTRLIAVHAGLESSKPIQQQLDLLRRRDVTHPRIEPLSGRKNVWDNPTELGNQGVLLVSGHHGAMFQQQNRLIIDESGGLEHLPIAAIVLPSRAIVFHAAALDVVAAKGLQFLQCLHVPTPPPMAAVYRQVLRDFVPRSLCKELEFIHRSCSVIGYRPHVRSTTLSHLIATNCSGLIVPFVSVRERLKELVEVQFGCEFELFVEFTGLLSWMEGSKIGWHSDDNKPYLKQRHFAAVCYINDYQVDFQGGLFHFREGEPTSVVPTTGTVVIYSADETNTHCVDEVLSGERCTLALWFTKDSAYDEDKKLIQQLSMHLPMSVPGIGCDQGKFQETCISAGQINSDGDSVFRRHPMPASTNMYWEGHGEPGTGTGYDIRRVRLEMMGYVLFPPTSPCVPPLDGPAGETEGPSVENESVMLQARDRSVHHTFRNSLHALQVVEFQLWKSCSKSARVGSAECNDISGAMEASTTDGGCRNQPQDTSNCSIDQVERLWECYIANLWQDLLILLPHWRACEALFP